MARYTLIINRRPYKWDDETLTPLDIITLGEFDGTDWNVFLTQGEGDPSGGELLKADDTVEVKSGLHFRIVPGNLTFGKEGAAGPPPRLAEHASEFERVTGLPVEVVCEDSRVFVMLRSVPLPSGRYAAEQTDLLFIADRQYPDSALDMFWTSVEVTLPDGGIPQGADVIETYMDQQWRRFSWHRNGPWNRNGNGLLDHYEVVRARWDAEVA